MKKKRYPVSEKPSASDGGVKGSLPKHHRNFSPVGWYVASYVVRFVELAWKNVNDPEERYLAWENTVLVKARDLSHAYEKTLAIAQGYTKPYKGGREGVDVRWIFEGVTEILPVYEEIEDGAEIMWAEYTRKLKTIRKRTKAKNQLYH